MTVEERSGYFAYLHKCASVTVKMQSLDIDAHDLEDIVSTAMIAYMEWVNSHEMLPIGRASALLATIARRKTMDWVRQQRRYRNRHVSQSLDDLLVRSTQLDRASDRFSWDELSDIMQKAARRVDRGTGQDLLLATRWLDGIKKHQSASARSIGLELWPHRPQTASERLRAIKGQVRKQLAVG